MQLNDEGGEAEKLQTDSDNPARIPLRPSALDSITNSGKRLLSNANVLIERLNLLLDDQNRERFAHILENTKGLPAACAASSVSWSLDSKPCRASRRTLAHCSAYRSIDSRPQPDDNQDKPGRGSR